MVAYETESQDPEQASELVRYLEQAMTARLSGLGFACEVHLPNAPADADDGGRDPQPTRRGRLRDHEHRRSFDAPRNVPRDHSATSRVDLVRRNRAVARSDSRYVAHRT